MSKKDQPVEEPEVDEEDEESDVYDDIEVRMRVASVRRAARTRSGCPGSL